jgi:hypothetical protein
MFCHQKSFLTVRERGTPEALESFCVRVESKDQSWFANVGGDDGQARVFFGAAYIAVSILVDLYLNVHIWQIN